MWTRRHTDILYSLEKTPCRPQNKWIPRQKIKMTQNVVMAERPHDVSRADSQLWGSAWCGLWVRRQAEGEGQQPGQRLTAKEKGSDGKRKTVEKGGIKWWEETRRNTPTSRAFPHNRSSSELFDQSKNFPPKSFNMSKMTVIKKGCGFLHLLFRRSVKKHVAKQLLSQKTTIIHKFHHISHLKLQVTLLISLRQIANCKMGSKHS